MFKMIKKINEVMDSFIENGSVIPIMNEIRLENGRTYSIIQNKIFTSRAMNNPNLKEARKIITMG